MFDFTSEKFSFLFSLDRNRVQEKFSTSNGPPFGGAATVSHNGCRFLTADGGGGGYSNNGTLSSRQHSDDDSLRRDSGTYQVGATRTSSLGSLQQLETDV